jgi:ABC-type branched-subunit amino acid transport system substrate-binding protein
MLDRYKHLGTLIILFVLYLSLPFVTNALFNESLEQAPVVLVVGDFSEEGFGRLVNNGVEAARKDEHNSPSHVATRQVSVNESAWSDAFGGSNTEVLDREIQSLRSKLIKEIADYNVVAIISANTSQTARTVLQVGKAFNIPVLITVATADNITEGYHDTALRLIARNSKQAEAIKEWCAEQTTRVGLVYDLTRYGIGLRDAVTERIGPDRLIPFSVNTTTDLAGILTYGKESEVQAWVVVGYRNQAVEFYSKKGALKLGGNMLFSDGAYGKWLSQLQEDPNNTQRVFLSFPSVPVNPNDELRGYATLGYDAYHLTSSAVGKLIGEGKTQKYRLMQAVREVAPGAYEAKQTKQEYKFDPTGENELANFTVTEVRHGTLP